MKLLELLFKANTSELDRATRSVKAVGSEAEKAQGKASKLDDSLEQLGQVGGPIGEVAGRVSQLKDQLSGLGGAARAGVPALVALAGSAGIIAAFRFAGTLDELTKLGMAFGYSASQAALLDAKLQGRGGLAGYERDLQRVTRALSQTDEESSKAAKAFQTLGISVNRASDPAKVLTQVVEQYGQKVANNNLTTEEQIALQAALGQSWKETVFRAQEAAGATEMYNRFAAAGIGISQQGEQAVGDYNDAMDGLSFITKVVGSQLVATVLPAFTSLIKVLVDSYTAGGAVKGAFDAIVTATNLVMVPIRVLIDGFTTLNFIMTSIGKTAGAIFAAIATRSSAPLKELREDLSKLREETTKAIQDNKLWTSGQGTVAAPPPAAPAATGNRAASRDAETAAAERLLMAERALAEMRRYEAAEEQAEIDRKRQLTAERDLAAQRAMREMEQNDRAEQQAQQLYERTVSTISAIQQNAIATGIYNRALAQVGATTEDANLAVIDYNLALLQAEQLRLRNANATGAEIQAIQSKIDIMNAEREAAGQRKADDQALLEEQNTFSNGWKTAFADFGASATNYAGMAQTAFSNAAEGMTDALTSFVLTGKADFKGFAASILSDIAKMITRMLVFKAIQAGMSFLGFGDGGAFSGGTQFFANGGVVNRPTAFGMSNGRMGVMGEAGPEAILPLRRGSDGKLGVASTGGAGNVTVQNNISVSIGSVDSEERQATLLREMAKITEATTKRTIADQMRPGGMLYAA